MKFFLSHNQNCKQTLPTLHNTHEQKKSRACFCANAAFTLIELLVVVLIIGILASIAVPKYTLMIEKGKAAEAMQNIHALADSMKRYFATNNSYPVALSDLDIQLEGDVIPGGIYGSDTVRKNKNFVYYMRSYAGTAVPEIVFCRINATRTNLTSTPHSTAPYCLSYYLVANPSMAGFKNNTYSCATPSTSKIGPTLCKTITGASTKFLTAASVDYYLFP